MALFVVGYVHPDRDGWIRHMSSHVDWLIEQVEAGVLLASGATTSSDERSALLVFRAPGMSALQAILDTDPFVRDGQVDPLQITPWDPFFGVLQEHSSQAGVAPEDVREWIMRSLPAP